VKATTRAGNVDTLTLRYLEFTLNADPSKYIIYSVLSRLQLNILRNDNIVNRKTLIVLSIDLFRRKGDLMKLQGRSTCSITHN